jgi:hypothetical protein
MSADIEQKTALELWCRWWNETNGEPWVGDTTDYGRDDSCFFCSSYRHESHDENCIYLQVAKLLEKHPKENEPND